MTKIYSAVSFYKSDEVINSQKTYAEITLVSPQGATGQLLCLTEKMVRTQKTRVLEREASLVSSCELG